MEDDSEDKLGASKVPAQHSVSQASDPKKLRGSSWALLSYLTWLQLDTLDPIQAN